MQIKSAVDLAARQSCTPGSHHRRSGSSMASHSRRHHHHHHHQHHLHLFVSSLCYSLSKKGFVFPVWDRLNGASKLPRVGNSRQIGRPKTTRNCTEIVCSGDRKDALPAPIISSAAKLRSEVISPFRSVRMFFYVAFIGSAGIGGLIACTRLIAALRNASNANQVSEIVQGLGIDIAAVVVFALLYRSDAKARDIQLAKLSREESLASLRLELSNKRIVSIGQMRGALRLVIIAGPGSYIDEAYRLSKPYQPELVERGVLIVPYVTDGSCMDRKVSKEAEIPLDDEPGKVPIFGESESRWRAVPIYTSEWGRWVDEQKSLANVPADKPVYLSLRLDGRVRGSGVGVPPWGALVAQLPPLKGIWAGALDGMDGRI